MIGVGLLLVVSKADRDICLQVSRNLTQIDSFSSRLVVHQEELNELNAEIPSSEDRLSIMHAYVAELYSRDWFRPKGPAPLVEEDEQNEIITTIYDALADAQEVQQMSFDKLRQLFAQYADSGVDSYGAPLIARLVSKAIVTERTGLKEVMDKVENVRNEIASISSVVEKIRTDTVKGLDKCLAEITQELGYLREMILASEKAHLEFLERGMFIHSVLDSIALQYRLPSYLLGSAAVIVLNPQLVVPSATFSDLFRQCFSVSTPWTGYNTAVITTQIHKAIQAYIHTWGFDAVMHAMLEDLVSFENNLGRWHVDQLRLAKLRLTEIENEESKYLSLEPLLYFV